MAYKVCKKALDDKLGIIAVDTINNKVVGFDLSMDIVDELENEKSKGEGGKFKMWGDFLLEMLSFYKDKFGTLHTAPKRGTVMCHNLIGVLPEYAPHKIGVTLLGCALELARTRGFSQVLTVATHIASQRLSEKLAFTPVGLLEFATCNYPPLRTIAEPTHSIIYVYYLAHSKL